MISLPNDPKDRLMLSISVGVVILVGFVAGISTLGGWLILMLAAAFLFSLGMFLGDLLQKNLSAHKPKATTVEAQFAKARKPKRPATAITAIEPVQQPEPTDVTATPEPIQEPPSSAPSPNFDHTHLYGESDENEPGIKGYLFRRYGIIFFLFALAIRYWLNPPFLGNQFQSVYWQGTFALVVAAIWVYSYVSPDSKRFDGAINWAMIIWAILMLA